MPQANGDVLIAELRRAVQQMFYGFASLIAGPEHRQAARDLVQQAVSELALRVRGERGEVVDDVVGAIRAALEAVKDVTLAAPEDEA